MQGLFKILLLFISVFRNIVSSFQSTISQRVLTFDCHTSLYGWEWFNDSITLWTVAATSWGYGSPLSTTYRCITWAALIKFACMCCRIWCITCKICKYWCCLYSTYKAIKFILWNMIKKSVCQWSSSQVLRSHFMTHDSWQHHQPHKKAPEALIT